MHNELDQPGASTSTEPAAVTSTASAAPPSPADVAWVAAISAVKATVVALAVDAFLHSDQPRYHGKGMRLRAIGYAGGMLAVPVAWRLLGRRAPYPRELDLAVTLPLLVDAGGNAIGIYRRARVDDLIHFADGALVSSVVGALATPRVRTSWEAAAVGTLGRGGRGRAVGGRRVGRPQARRQGDGPDLRRHDDRPHRDDGRGSARRRDHPAAPSITAPTACPAARPIRSSRRTRAADGRRARPSGDSRQPVGIEFVGHATVPGRDRRPARPDRPVPAHAAWAHWNATARHRTRSRRPTSTWWSSRTATPTTSIRPRFASLRGSPTVVVPRGLGGRARRAVAGDGHRSRGRGRASRSVAWPSRSSRPRTGSRRGRRARSRSGTCVDAGPRVYFAGDTGRFDGIDRCWPASTSRCCPSGPGAHTADRATSARDRRPRPSPPPDRPWRSRSTGERSIRGGSTTSGRDRCENPATDSPSMPPASRPRLVSRCSGRADPRSSTSGADTGRPLVGPRQRPLCPVR